MHTAHNKTTPTNLYFFAEFYKKGPARSKKQVAIQFGVALACQTKLICIFSGLKFQNPSYSCML